MASIKKRVWLKDQRPPDRFDGPPMPSASDYGGADVAWACSRKKSYSEEKFARRVAMRMRAERGANVVAYSCRHCGEYHIGRAPA